MNNSLGESLNDIAWQDLFSKYEILKKIENEGLFKISANSIKEFREPRLMVKFDHLANLPQLFKDNNLAILPVSRGDYVISHFKAYHSFDTTETEIIPVTIPQHLQSLDFKNISSESIALNSALASQILTDFLDEEEIYATVSGRMGSGVFNFNIENTNLNRQQSIKVENSQIEIDAAYEGIKSLAIFEAKIDLSEDFLVRQMYYPYRVWESKIRKEVRTVFLIYSNGIYRLFEYKFLDKNDYNSLNLVKKRNYSLEDTAIEITDIEILLQQAPILEEPQIPFPQADSFERVINICELINDLEITRDEVTEQYSFDARQTNYYTDAARYIGLLDRKYKGKLPVYFLTDTGRKILKLGYKERQLAYCVQILKHKAFHFTLSRYLERGTMPSIEEIVRIMINSQLYEVRGESTLKRRASTIRGWVNWIVSLINN